MNDKGQALIETTVVIMGTIVVFIGVLSTISHFGHHYWSHYHLHQANLCLATEKSKSFCERELRQRLSLWPLQPNQWPRLSKSNSNFKAELKLKQKEKIILHLPRNLRSSDFKGHYE